MDNKKELEIEDINFGNLTVVQIDFLEMTRQIQKISLLSEEAKSKITHFKNALIELSGLLNINISAIGLDEIEERIKNIGIYGGSSSSSIIGRMETQLNKFKNQNEEINNQLTYLLKIVETAQSTNAEIGWVYENLNYNGQLLSYNEILQKNERIKQIGTLSKMLDVSKEDIMTMLETDTTNFTTSNFYKTIEENYGYNSGEGKIVINELLNKIQENPALTNREKAVQTALVLNKICYSNEIKIPYVGADQHSGYNIETVAVNSDCSSYVTYLLKQGNSEITGGGTGWLVSTERNEYITPSSEGLTGLQAGDIIVKSGYGPPYDHALFFLGYDEKGGLLCTENYGGNGSGTRLYVYTTDELSKNGYNGYNVDYDGGNSTSVM